MGRLIAVAATAALAACGTWLVLGEGTSAAGTAGARTVVVRVGDHIRVADAPLGCRIVKTRQLHGRVVVDCRRGGSLHGTYGTLLTAHEAALIRFESRHTARLAYVAVHHGLVRKCGAQR
jgi:hypothetical protein